MDGDWKCVNSALEEMLHVMADSGSIDGIGLCKKHMLFFFCERGTIGS